MMQNYIPAIKYLALYYTMQNPMRFVFFLVLGSLILTRPNDLLENNWQLLSNKDRKTNTYKTLTEWHETLNFQKDGKYGGRCNCNGYGGNYKIEYDSIIKLDYPIHTKINCPGILIYELPKVQYFKLYQDTLKLFIDANDVMTFVKK